MDQITDQIEKINQFIQSKAWFDFEVVEFSKGNLKIIGSTDFSYYYELEIILEEVFFMQLNREWQSDTSHPVIVIPDIEEQRKINMQFQVEQGYTLFRINTDESYCFYVSAKTINAKFETIKFE